MSYYNQILGEFSSLGFSEGSNLTERELYKALDDICMKNAGIRQFDRTVGEEIWGESQKTSEGSARLKDVINTIIKAQNLLKEHIQKCEEQLKTDVPPERATELQEIIVQYSDDHKILTVPFRIQNLPESKLVAESRRSVIQQNVDGSRLSNRSGNSRMSGMQASGYSGMVSAIFADVPSAREDSCSLKFTFILAFILFLFELILMYHKHHFLNVLIYVSIFGIIFMGYFDKHYIKFILASLGVSTVLDLIWIIVQAPHYWNPYAETQHSTLQTGFLRFIFLFVIFLMIGKILLLILLFRYRNNESGVRKSVSIFGNLFQINGNINENNPLSKILSSGADKPANNLE